jgi:hypothetical protein
LRTTGLEKAMAPVTLKDAICAAFAAPLLKLVGMSSFAIFLTGASKIGS